MPVQFAVRFQRPHARHAAPVCARVKHDGAPLRCPEPAALETFGFPAVPSRAVRGHQDTRIRS